MCGIAGILNLRDGESPTESVLRAMLGTLRHRGPDQFGIYLQPRLGMGNARLSIVDVASGQQPISNENGRYWVVFNGEIFNHVELREELERRGHRFETRCDTEVLVHLYEEEGPAGLRRLNGQFAFAIWDTVERSLFLARDRVGVRPLFITESAERLVFGSEIKALLAAPGVAVEADPRGLEEVFTFWSPQAGRTCFRGIRSLPAGHYLLARDGRCEVVRYWQPSFAGEGGGRPGSLDDHAEQLGALLTDATRIRLRADVPVGAYLSGGLDSSLIASMVRRLGVSRLDTFSIAFSDPRYDESSFQRRMAEALGTEHQVVQATHADIGTVFPEVIWHTESPLVRTSPAPMFLLSRLVRQRGYKVVLTGEGADEFFGGYDIFKETQVRRFWARQPESRWRPQLLRRLYADIPALSATGGAFLAAFFGAGLRETGDPWYSHALRWRNGRRQARFFTPGFKAAWGGLAPTEVPDPSLELPPEFERWSSLERAQYLEIATFLTPYLLSSQGDRVGMANSVEGRFPFLDVRVMEFSGTLPARHKLRCLREKHVLRRLAESWLPAEIWNRPKRPYRAPIHRSFVGPEAPGYVAELLSESALARTGVFLPAAVKQLLAKLGSDRPAGEMDEMALVGIVSTQLWYDAFVHRRRTPEPVDERDDVKVVR